MVEAKTPKLKLNERNVEQVLNALSLEEKAALLVGTGMYLGDSESPAPVVGTAYKLVPGAAGTTAENTRFGVPPVVLSDGPAGVRIDAHRKGDDRTYYCTHFPIGTLLACTWDEELVRNVGSAIGEEAAAYGVDVMLSPALNIHRHPLCGRNFEYFCEDPLLAGKTAAAYVQGVQSHHVGATLKHFAANNQETNRMGNNAIISPRALREIYLRGFEIAVREGQPWCLMTSYNRLNGSFTAEDSVLLTDLLRDEWGFDGVVMSDWFGGFEADRMVSAGNDLLQPGRESQRQALVEAVRSGKLDEAVVDRSVRRVLELALRSNRFRGLKATNNPDLKAHAAVTRRSATEGMVLLKNDHATLPLPTSTSKVALYGITSYDFIAGGTGSGNVNRAYTVTLIDGLEGAGYVIDSELRSTYETAIANYVPDAKPGGSFAAFMPDQRQPELLIDSAAIAAEANRCDVAVITIGRTSGEFYDRLPSDFMLTSNEEALIESVSEAFHAAGKRVVVVLNVGGVIETDRWRDAPDAILLAWQAGQEGGNSVADVLCGKANPSGRLAMTWPIKFTDHFSSLNFPINQKSPLKVDGAIAEAGNTKDVDFTRYDEGIYVGYRYFDTKQVPVAYPFGYGLSYTTFAYGQPTVAVTTDSVTVSLDVTNSGNRTGREVVQLYVTAPALSISDKPTKELKAFAKTHELQPGASERIELKVPRTLLASFDERRQAWVADGGEYTLLVGASIDDIRQRTTATLPEVISPVRAIFHSAY